MPRNRQVLPQLLSNPAEALRIFVSCIEQAFELTSQFILQSLDCMRRRFAYVSNFVLWSSVDLG